MAINDYRPSGPGVPGIYGSGGSGPRPAGGPYNQGLGPNSFGNSAGQTIGISKQNLPPAEPGGLPRQKPPVKVAGPKARAEGETDAKYQKRVSNWKMSQDRLKSVGITGGVNKASEAQLKAFSAKYGKGPSGLKPRTPANPVPPKPSVGPGGRERRYGARAMAELAERGLRGNSRL